MTPKRWFLSFLIAIVAVLLTDYFFLHFVFPAKREAVLYELQEKVERELRENPILPVPELPHPEEVPDPRQQKPTRPQTD